MVWGTFLGKNLLDFGGLDPCQDGLGHFYRRRSAPECPFECRGVDCKSFLGNAQMPGSWIWVGLPKSSYPEFLLLFKGLSKTMRLKWLTRLNSSKDLQAWMVIQIQYSQLLITIRQHDQPSSQCCHYLVEAWNPEHLPRQTQPSQRQWVQGE